MDPQPPSDADLQRLFDSPGDVPVGSFEIALVLGGTVSSGAYTAGYWISWWKHWTLG